MGATLVKLASGTAHTFAGTYQLPRLKRQLLIGKNELSGRRGTGNVDTQ